MQIDTPDLVVKILNHLNLELGSKININSVYCCYGLLHNSSLLKYTS